MTSLDELLDSASPQSSDVSISLDGALAAERDRLVAEAHAAIKNAGNDDRLGQKPRAVELTEQVQELEAQLRDRLITIRITQMPGSAWAALKAQHPVGKSPGPYDKAQGYNVEAVARKALMSHGARVVGDETEKLTAAQWQKLFDTVSGGDFQNLILETLNVNQLKSQITVANLSKGSRRTTDSAQN